jgi:hypothetical protein
VSLKCHPKRADDSAIRPRILGQTRHLPSRCGGYWFKHGSPRRGSTASGQPGGGQARHHLAANAGQDSAARAKLPNLAQASTGSAAGWHVVIGALNSSAGGGGALWLVGLTMCAGGWRSASGRTADRLAPGTSPFDRAGWLRRDWYSATSRSTAELGPSQVITRNRHGVHMEDTEWAACRW